MLKVRVIPILLLRDSVLVKGENFKNHKYVGDPINAVKIFNEKEVDEITFLDISEHRFGNGPNFEIIKSIASEAFMPLGYGGGVTNLSQIEKLFNIGVEKVILNTTAYHNNKIISEASSIAGSQSIVVSIDVKKNWLGSYEVYIKNGETNTNENPIDYAKRMRDLGAGELIICSIDREGTGLGYDLNIIKRITDAVDIPVVASGGAGKFEDFSRVIKECNVSAVAAGNLFTFYGKHKAVLITYPSYRELKMLIG